MKDCKFCNVAEYSIVLSVWYSHVKISQSHNMRRSTTYVVLFTVLFVVSEGKHDSRMRYNADALVIDTNNFTRELENIKL